MKIFPQHHQIEFEKNNYVYAHLATGLVMHIAVGAALVAVMYEASGWKRTLGWYACLLLVVMARFSILFFYRRSKDVAVNIKKWRTAFIAGSLTTGLVWGVCGIALFPDNDVGRQIFLSFIIGGMAMGAVPYLSPLLPAYWVFIFPMEIPINIYLFTFADSLHVILGIVNILFTITMLVAAKFNQKNFVHNIMLRFVNEDLVKRLNDTNNELENKIYLKGKVEQDLRENEHRYMALSNAAHDGVILHKRGIIIEANQAAAKKSGYTVRELIGKSVLELIAEHCHEDIIQRLANPFDETFETDCLRKDGSIFRAELNPDNVTYKGEPARIVSIRDVSKQRQIEADLLRAKNAAEEADKLKSEFLASVSHELRTPLNAIIGILQILEDSALKKDQHDYVEMGEKAARQLLLLINDLLDLSRIESGNIEYNYQDSNLYALLYETIQIMSFKARERNNDLKLMIYDALPEFVRIEPDRVRQVLLNLLGNAIKFTMDGQIILRVTTECGKGKGEMLRFEVTDNGIGIPTNKQQIIFKRFTQLDSSISRTYGGTGLGLAICHELVEAMGGAIGVTSQEGAGATFWFDIPFVRVEQSLTSQSQGLIAKNKVMPTGLRILVVEDDETNQLIVRRMLEKMGQQVDVLSDGQQAVECAKRYDLIFMDMQMPVLDGLAATRILRDTGIKTPIIALTANAMPEDQELCLQAGMNDYLSKPVEKDKLISMLTRWGPQQKQSASQRGG